MLMWAMDVPEGSTAKIGELGLPITSYRGPVLLVRGNRALALTDLVAPTTSGAMPRLAIRRALPPFPIVRIGDYPLDELTSKVQGQPLALFEVLIPKVIASALSLG